MIKIIKHFNSANIFIILYSYFVLMVNANTSGYCDDHSCSKTSLWDRCCFTSSCRLVLSVIIHCTN